MRRDLGWLRGLPQLQLVDFYGLYSYDEERMQVLYCKTDTPCKFAVYFEGRRWACRS